MSHPTAIRLLAVGLFSCLLAATAAAGEEVVVDGVLHVRNGAEPAEGVQTMELEELWRVGGDDEDVLLGIVTRALLDDAGNIFLLDQQLSEVKVIGPDGELIRTLGRQGEGPGEVTRPGDFLFMPDGTLGLVQIFPGKIVKLDLEGNPAGEFHPDTGEATAGGFLALINCRSAGGNLVLAGVKIAINQAEASQDRVYFVRSYDTDGKQLAEYFTKTVHWNLRDNFVFREIDNDFIWWRMDVGRDGRVVICQERYDYALSVYNADGTLDRVIERSYESWPRNELVMSRYEAIMEAQSAQFPPGTEHVAEKLEQDVEDLRVAPDGSIWVLPSRQMFEPEPGFFARYDVFDPAGRFVRQVKVKCEGSAVTDRLIFAGDRVFRVTGFWDAVLNARGAGAGEDEAEARPMEVVCYKVR